MMRLMVLLNDGVFSCRTGAGRMNAALLAHLATRTRYWDRVTVVASRIQTDSPVFDLDTWTRTQQHLSRPDWDLAELPDPLTVRGQYSGYREWAHLSDAATELVTKSYTEAGSTAVLSSDVPFLGLRLRKRTKRLHMVHTLNRLQAPQDHEWARWELDQYSTWIEHRGLLSVPSRFLRDALVLDFPELAGRVVLCRNGLGNQPEGGTRDDGDRDRRPSEGGCRSRLQRAEQPQPYILDRLPSRPRAETQTENRDGPTDLLTYARALPAKRLDDAILAFTKLRSSGRKISLTVVAAPESSCPGYIEHLRQMASATNGVTLHTSFRSDLPARIADRGLAAVVIPSIDEPAGLAPVECYRWSRGAVPVIRPSGGLAETVDESTGLVSSDLSVDGLAGAMASALTLSGSTRAALVQAGRERLRREHDFDCNADVAMTQAGLLTVGA